MARAAVLRCLAPGSGPAGSGSSPLRPEVLRAYALEAGDPDLEAISWLDPGQGAPIGILGDIAAPFIFPKAELDGFRDDADANGFDALSGNYASADEHPEVVKAELERFVRKG